MKIFLNIIFDLNYELKKGKNKMLFFNIKKYVKIGYLLNSLKIKKMKIKILF